jgi:hypothetical protein
MSETIPATMKCADCVFWERTDHPCDRTDLGECSKAAVLWNATDWQENEDGETVRVILPQFESQMLFAQDGSDYSASVITRHDFFCAHFEAVSVARKAFREGEK